MNYLICGHTIHWTHIRVVTNCKYCCADESEFIWDLRSVNNNIIIMRSVLTSQHTQTNVLLIKSTFVLKMMKDRFFCWWVKFIFKIFLSLFFFHSLQIWFCFCVSSMGSFWNGNQLFFSSFLQHEVFRILFSILFNKYFFSFWCT